MPYWKHIVIKTSNTVPSWALLFSWFQYLNFILKVLKRKPERWIHRIACLLKGCEKEVLRDCSFVFSSLSVSLPPCLRFFPGYQKSHLCAASSDLVSCVGSRPFSLTYYYERPSINIFRTSLFWTFQIFFLFGVHFYFKESFMSWRTNFLSSDWLLFTVISFSPSTKLRSSDLFWFSLLNLHYLFIWFWQFRL